jgi:hypothetical protein
VRGMGMTAAGRKDGSVCNRQSFAFGARTYRATAAVAIMFERLFDHASSSASIG